MADLPDDPRCRFCGHLSSSHTYEASADLSVPCAACGGGRCPRLPGGIRIVVDEAMPAGVAELRSGDLPGIRFFTGVTPRWGTAGG